MILVKAAALTSFGGPEVLTLTEVASPQAGPGQLRVRVRSAGVNHFDTAIRKGWAPPTVDNSFPVVPGNEYAGVVDQVGEGVTGHSVGTPSSATAHWAPTPSTWWSPPSR